MIVSNLNSSTNKTISEPNVRVIRHNQVCEKIQISSAKLFDMVSRGQFPKPFILVPGGRAVGWLESDVTSWILERKESGSSKNLTTQASIIECSIRGENHE